MKISVSLCTYNGGAFLDKQLKSIFAQSHPVDEIVICDDISTDTTLDIIAQYEKAFPGKISLFKNDANLGPKKNFEKAITLSTGDIIFLSDQDDTWPPIKIEKVVEAFNANPEIKGLFTNGILMDDNDEEFGYTLWHSFMYTTFMQNKLNATNLFEMVLRNGALITGATVAIKKDAKTDILPFKYMDELWHDEWIGYRLSAINKFLPFNQKLFNYRIHAAQQVGVYIADFDNRIAQRERFFKKEFNKGEEGYYVAYIYKRLIDARKICNYIPGKGDVLNKLELEFKIEKRKSLQAFGFVKRKLILFKWFFERRYETSVGDILFT